MAEVSLPEVATARQLAEFLGVSEASLAQDRYLRKGVPFTRVGGRRIRYLRDDVLKYLQANRINGDAA
ncbi:helix-turn-helix domain-containing protein [Mycobacterium paraffinicum]|uniref:Helix-turn-helix domain-containing protein n=1 Tax=Mycobacterium paraffinicum TaxID=53378 RepID=A0ABP8F424_9MYCO|nr:helix-turn-helix domain-containing protein [Mycobacterium paraffinicum]